MREFDLIIVGVGGQGAITASDIIGKAAVRQGLSVQASETHGMAQRGGSVINHVRPVSYTHLTLPTTPYV